MLRDFSHDNGHESAAFIRESDDDAETLHVIGEVDLANADQLAQVLGAINVAPRQTLDLTGCTFVDSTALRAIVRAYTAAHGRLRIVIPDNGTVRRMFQVAGLFEHLGLTLP